MIRINDQRDCKLGVDMVQSRECACPLGSRDGAVVENSPPMQASHQCAPGSIPGLGVKSGLSLFCCWFSSLLREVFLRVLRFSPLLKNQHFRIPIRSGIRGPQICQSHCLSVVLLSVTLVK